MHSIQILTVSIVLMMFVGNTQSCFVSQGPPLNDPIDDRCKGWTFKDEATKSCFKVFNGHDTRNWFDAMSKCQQFKGSNAFLATLPSLPAATLEKVTDAVGSAADKLWAGGVCGSPALSGRNMCFSYVPGSADVCGILDNCMAEYSYVCQAYYDVDGPAMSGQALPASCYNNYINTCLF